LFKTIERFTTLLFQHSIRQYATYLYLHNESKLFFSRQCEDTFAWFAPLEAERKRVRTLASSVAGRNESCRERTVRRIYISQWAQIVFVSSRQKDLKLISQWVVLFL